MLQYSFNNIEELIKYNKYNINSNITKEIDKYTTLVTSPNYIKSPHFLIKKSIILDNNRNKIVTLQDGLKKILNKITEKNYNKLINEIIIIINNLLKEINQDNNIEKEKILEILFNNFFISSINIDLNLQICFRLIDEFHFVQVYFNNFINNIKNLHSNVQVCKTIQFEELNNVNKNNTIIKNKIIFYSRLNKYGKLHNNTLNECIIHYQNILFNMFKEDNSRDKCDEISELLLTFLNEKEILSINDLNESIIINNIKKIIDNNVDNKKNLSLKIVLKHKNLLSKFNL